MIRIELTQKQHRQLRKQFEMIECAFEVGQRGIFIAQVVENWMRDGGYVNARFFPFALAEPIRLAVKAARIPNCWAGIPSSSFNGDAR